MTSGQVSERVRPGRTTNLILETGFVEDAAAFGYVFGNLQAIQSKKDSADKEKFGRTEGSWPVPIGMRQKSLNNACKIAFYESGV